LIFGYFFIKKKVMTKTSNKLFSTEIPGQAQNDSLLDRPSIAIGIPAPMPTAGRKETKNKKSRFEVTKRLLIKQLKTNY
jgi:hypothetical protein